ncbi:MAG: hypothetical protein EXQ55_02305 [Acidobacteria bacterium]|nr:hypothetical protein [Acidobacteriota bacterium]
MPEFNIRTDSVDVEQIMRQIRARIKEKRGVDYTEQQIQELANVKLERFLDPKGVRSDLVEQFKRTRGTSPEPPNYGFEDTTLYETHRGIVRFIRRLLNPILKLFFNPNPIVHVLHLQGQINNINSQQFRVREQLDALYYEVIHNLVLEVTRLGIETKNLKMRLESLNSRMDFDERRARALEGVVQYRPDTGPSREPAVPKGSGPSGSASAGGSGATGVGKGETDRTRPAGDGWRSRQPQAYQPQAEQAPPRPQEQPAAAGGGDQAGETASGAPGTARRRRRRRRGRRGGRVPGLGVGLGATTSGAPGEAAPGAPRPDDLGAESAPSHEDSGSDFDADPGDADGPDSSGSGPEQ